MHIFGKWARSVMLSGIACAALAIGVLPAQVANATVPGGGGQPQPAASGFMPTVITAVAHNKTAPLSELAKQMGKPKPAGATKTRTVTSHKLGTKGATPAKDVKGGSARVQTSAPGGNMPSFDKNFEGVGNLDGVLPPDTEGDVGPNNYVQWINLHFQVFDKNGTSLLGPLPGNTFWQGIGGACATHNDGDPIIQYDHLANRWMASQFALFATDGFHQCVAVSQTGDPTGAWNAYDFPIPAGIFNDYPHFGVWPDAYYMSINEFDPNSSAFKGAGAAAFERNAMIAGADAPRMVFFDEGTVSTDFGGQLPSDLDGDPPPVGAPNVFAEVDDSAVSNFPTDSMRLWNFHVDWSNPADSTFGANGQPNQVIDVAPMDMNMCNFNRNCIKQPGTAQGLDAISDRLMYRLQYRNFGDHQTLVTNHTVDVDGTDHAGVRWYELNSTDPAGNWSMKQQGTYAPDSDNRWMGSAAMDASGDIAVGFSVSSASTFPSIRTAGRLAGDPAGQLTQGESQLIAGTGSQTHSAARWGDYSMLAVDPTDQCTFWYTTEYLTQTSVADWHTRIGSLKFPGCSQGPHGDITGTVTAADTGDPIEDATVTAGNASTRTDQDGHYTLTLPVGSYDMTASAFGYKQATASGVEVTDGGSTKQDFALNAVPMASVTGTVTDGSAHGWPLYAKITAKDVPDGSTYTDPATGHYSIRLPEGATYSFKVEAQYPGYNTVTQDVTVGSGDKVQDFAVTVDQGTCIAAGYEFQNVQAGSTEQFTGWTGKTPQDGWTVTDGVGNGQTWDFDNARNRTAPPNSDGDLAIVDSDNYGSGNHQDTSLVSSSYDLTDNTAPVVQFDTRYQAYPTSVADVDYSTDGGSTWTNAWHQTSTTVTGHVLASIAGAAGKSDVQLRFHYTGTWAWYWLVDNVSVGDRPCVATQGGLVLGHVNDQNTGDGVNGAKVASDDKPDESAKSATTPDDPNLADGFYWMFSSLTGSHGFTASAGSYQSQTETKDVAADSANVVNFSLKAGRLDVQPSALDDTVTLGESTTDKFTVTNTGTAPASVKLSEQDKGFEILRPDGTTISDEEERQSLGTEVHEVNGHFSPNWIGNQIKPNGTISEPPPAPNAPPWQNIANYPVNVMDNAVTFIDGKVYSFTGVDALGNWLSQTEVYDPAAGTWSQAAPIPTAREKPAAAAINGKVYVTGGWNASGANVTSTQVYDPSSDSWSTGASMPVGGYAGSGVGVLDGKMYVVGGCQADCGRTTVQAYDPGSDSWSQVADYPEPISWNACGALEGQLICAGGSAATSTAHAYSYNPSSDSWTRIEDLPIDLWAMGSTAANGSLLVSGGVTNGFNTLTNRGFSYTPGEGWSDLPNSNNTLYRGGSACGFYKVGGATGGFAATNLAEVLPGFTECGGAADVPWLSNDPTEFTLDPGQSVQVTMSLDSSGVTQPGEYDAAVGIGEDTPYSVKPVDVTMHVNPPNRWGALKGEVKGTTCKGETEELAGATVQIDGTLQSSTLKTDKEGKYALWLDSENNPINMIVSKDGWQPQSNHKVRVQPHKTTVADFTLQEANCK